MPNFDLGKYAIYIVPAYAIAFMVIGAASADTLLRARRWKREVEKRESLKADKNKA